MDAIEIRIDNATRRVVPVRPTSAVEAFEEHRTDLERYLTWRTRDPDEAAEIAQETFLRLWRMEHEGRGPEAVRAWLFRVASNLATSHLRHRTVVQRSEDRLIRSVPQADSPEDDLARREDVRRLRLALANVSPDARTALLMAAEGYSSREIAEQIGRTEAATRTLVCRARARVREVLEAAEAVERQRAELAVRVIRRGLVVRV